jgi:hypothetical protein
MFEVSVHDELCLQAKCSKPIQSTKAHSVGLQKIMFPTIPGTCVAQATRPCSNPSSSNSYLSVINISLSSGLQTPTTTAWRQQINNTSWGPAVLPLPKRILHVVWARLRPKRSQPSLAPPDRRFTHTTYPSRTIVPDRTRLYILSSLRPKFLTVLAILRLSLLTSRLSHGLLSCSWRSFRHGASQHVHTSPCRCSLLATKQTTLFFVLGAPPSSLLKGTNTRSLCRTTTLRI